MYCVNVALGSTVWRLLFKDEDKFNAVRKELDIAVSTNMPKIIADEYGQEMVLFPQHVIGLMFEF